LLEKLLELKIRYQIKIISAGEKKMSVNVNVFNFNANGVQPNLFEGVNSQAFQGVNDILSDIFKDFSQLFNSVGNQFSGNQNIAQGGCCVPPSPFDGSQPQGSLKSDGNKITTPGGYTIESTGKFDWKITGPDGKVTDVQGDPHVIEGDGGKWDFKKNSTFVLGDGTKVNVTTTPYGNGATVTQGLEVISGNDRVTMSGMDKGKGVISQITQDGYAHANDFGGNDVFVMGKETDDWSLQGKEVIGSNNGGDSFKLGNDLAAGNTNGNQVTPNMDFNKMLSNFVNELIGNWNPSWKPNTVGQNPYYNGLSNNNSNTSNNLWAGNNTNTTNWNGNNYNRSQHQNQMQQAFRLFGQLFNVMARLSSLSDQMSTLRNRTMYA
jgi:Domain of Unknown Function (DUF1521)